MHCRFIVFTLLIALLLLTSAETEARPVPSALDSTDRVTYVYDGPPVFFGPNNAIAQIEVTDRFEINDVDVLVSITHSWVNDVVLRLENPEGVAVLLVGEEGGGEDNFTNTEFNDDAPESITQGWPPYTGSYRPEEPLSTFNGGTGIGTWTLYLEDTWPSIDDGTLTMFELTLGGQIGGAVRGRVVSIGTHAPLSGVRVELVGSPYFTETDELGNYFVAAAEGTYDLLVSFPFWCPQQIHAVEITENDTLDFDFELGKPEAAYSSTSLNILAEQSGVTHKTFDLANDGTCALDWTIDFQEEWIWADPSSGSLEGDDEIEIVVSIDGEQLEPGDYSSRMTITHNAEHSPHTIPVFVSVVPPQGIAEAAPIPQEFALLGAYPNPFNASTGIRYALPVMSDVVLAVYSCDGRLVERINVPNVQAGIHDLSVDLNRSASGVYIAQLQAGDFSGVQKLILIK